VNLLKQLGFLDYSLLLGVEKLKEPHSQLEEEV